MVSYQQQMLQKGTSSHNPQLCCFLKHEVLISSRFYHQKFLPDRRCSRQVLIRLLLYLLIDRFFNYTPCYVTESGNSKGFTTYAFTNSFSICSQKYTTPYPVASGRIREPPYASPFPVSTPVNSFLIFYTGQTNNQSLLHQHQYLLQEHQYLVRYVCKAQS